jgi:hypothetical protein
MLSADEKKFIALWTVVLVGGAALIASAVHWLWTVIA